MLRLMLLRHAKSDWSATDAPDHERTLNQRGRASAPADGTLHGAGTTAARARALFDRHAHPRNLRACRRGISTSARRSITSDRFMATPETIIKIIAAAPANEVHTLLVIGHNPGMQLAALTLAPVGHAKTTREIAREVPDRRRSP